MKTRLLALFAVAVLMCVPVFAQSSDAASSSDTMKQDSTSQDTTKQDSTSQDTPSQDSMKHDDMKQDSASQDSMKHDGTTAAGSAKAGKAKLRRLSGTVGSDGTTLVTDKDQKSWTVQNPEVFKGHEGHHVRVRAHVYPDKNSIHVMSVKMAKEKSAKAADTTKQ
jgi:pentapeptide MXKDX repeat protein